MDEKNLLLNICQPVFDKIFKEMKLQKLVINFK